MIPIAKFFYENLNSKRVHVGLLLSVFLVSIVIFNISSAITFPDAAAYWLMGESIYLGKFSSWYVLTDYYPETLRTPGYPIFLAACQLASGSQYFAKLIQLALYFISVAICLSIIKDIDKKLIFRNIFLLLLIPNLQIVYYTGYISSEMLTVFFVVLMMKLVFSKKSNSNALLLGVVSYLLFITKPAFLLFPFLISIYFVFKNKKDLRFSLIYVFSFCVLLVPFGLWNKVNHGKFTVTSIEGGAGVAHLGYWQLKLPDGYLEPFYWNNNTSYDYTKPNFFSEKELQDNVYKFEKEWNVILKDLNKHITPKDSAALLYMKENNPGIFLLYNSEFTLDREKQLWSLTIGHVKENPLYYLKSRLYHFVRFYVTGINYKNLNEATGVLSKAKVVYPFFITFSFIFVGLLLSTIIFLRKKNGLLQYLPFILVAWYISLVHLPFAIQARYTVPVHLIIILALSVSINKLIIKYNHE